MAHIQKGEDAAWRSLLVLASTEGQIEDAAVALKGISKESEGILCPLTGLDATAIGWSMPEKLKEVARDSECNALRLWTTVLTVTQLRRMDESFLFKTEDRDGFEETVVDRGMDFLQATARGLICSLAVVSCLSSRCSLLTASCAAAFFFCVRNIICPNECNAC